MKSGWRGLGGRNDSSSHSISRPKPLLFTVPWPWLSAASSAEFRIWRDLWPDSLCPQALGGRGPRPDLLPSGCCSIRGRAMECSLHGMLDHPAWEAPRMFHFTDWYILNSGEKNVKLPTSYFAWERTLEKELSLCSLPVLDGGFAVCSLSGKASVWTRVSMTNLSICLRKKMYSKNYHAPSPHRFI